MASRDWRKILADAVTRDLTARQVAEERGVSPGTVHNNCWINGVKLRGARRGVAPKCDWSRALQQAAKDGLNVAETARRHNVSSALICKHTERLGIRLRGQLKQISAGAGA